MSIKQAISKLKSMSHRGRYLLLALTFMTAMTAGSVAFAVPTDTTGDIAGAVTDQNGAGIAGIKVDAFILGGDMSKGSSVTWTGSDGSYDLNGLPTNTYVVLFNNIPGPGEPGAYYTHQWYNNQRTGGGATPDYVNVTAGQTTSNINAVLDPAGAVSGRIVDENGHGIPNIKVTAYASPSDYNNPGNPINEAFVSTDDNGYYYLGCLPASDTYIVDVNGPGDTLVNYHSEVFYDGQQSADTATPIVVRNDETTPDINATLQTYGTISGMVTDTSGMPAQAYVSAYASSTDFYNNTPAVSVPVNSDGSYALYGLSAGTYYLYFAPQSGYFYAPQFYNNQPTIGSAAMVTVNKGVTTQNIDATLSVIPATMGSVEAHTNKLLPAAMGPDSDSLPGLQGMLTTTASADVNVHNKKQGPTGGVTFTYNASGHTMKFVAKTISQFYEYGTNNASAGFQGTGSLTIDGVTTTNQFSVVVTDGKLLGSKTSDQFGIYIWAAGANTSTTPPQYYLNKPLPNGNVIVKQ